jgi:hypothetical protein
MRNATTSNPDYIEVQAKILQESAGMRVGRTATKARRRFSATINGAAKRKTGREQASKAVGSLAQMMMQG